MKNYEAFIILKPILDVDNSDNTLKVVEDTIENLKGKITRKEKLGRKRLAYEIKKFKDGFITSYVLSMDPATIKEFQRICHLNEDILRMVILDRNAYDLTQPLSTPRPESRFGDRERGGDRPDFRGGDRGDRPQRNDRPYPPRQPMHQGPPPVQHVQAQSAE